METHNMENQNMETPSMNQDITHIITIQRWFKSINKLSDTDIFNKINNKELLQEKMGKLEYLLLEFGTKEPCNRFDVGNSIEFIVSELLTESGLDVSELPNAKRVDLNIKNYGSLSIKYSSTGDITLHNSNSCLNKDEHMTDLILLTMNKIYLITNKEVKKNNINLPDYLKNTGDSLKLKRSILKKLNDNNYPFIIDFNLDVDKEKCKNRLTSKVFYSKFSEEYDTITKTKVHY